MPVKKKKQDEQDVRAQRFGRIVKGLRKDKLGLDQKGLAAKMQVTRPTVTAWELGYYLPSAEQLIKLANLLSYPDCLIPLGEAGFDVEKHYSEGIRKLPAEGMMRVPLVTDTGGGTADLPEWPGLNADSSICVQVSGPGRFFPFKNGDIAVIDKSQTSAWMLEGELVAIQFEEYPEVIPVPLLRPEGAKKLDIGEPALLEKLNPRSNPKEIEELERRWTPVNGMIRLEAIHLGWLCLERPDDPAFQYRQLDRFKPPQGAPFEPWRFVLEGAMVRGAGRGGPQAKGCWRGFRSTDRLANIRASPLVR